MSILDDIAKAWGWIGLRPKNVLLQNEFGNVIVQADDGQVWWICPETPGSGVIALDAFAFYRIRDEPEFNLVWSMHLPIAPAKRELGTLPPGRRYCVKIPLILGGTLEPDNLATIDFQELISFSGHLAHQLDRLPDGSKIILDTSRKN